MRVLAIILFTLVVHKVFSQDGPGGVAARNGSSDLLLWLTSSDFVTHGYLPGDGVHTWMDLSGRASHTNLGPSAPEFVPDFINGFPALQFQSASQEYLNGLLNTIPTSPLTIIAIANFSNLQPTGTGQYIIGLGGGSNDQASISRQSGDAALPYAYYSFEGPFTSPMRSIGPAVNSNQWHAFMSLYSNNMPYHSLYLNNVVQSIVNDFTAPPTWGNANFDIGRNAAGTAISYLDGNIAEIIIFNGLLNVVERNILFNYLSAKYNITIDSDLYNYDAASNNFDMEVVGIGSESGNIQNTAVSGGLTIATDDVFGGSTDRIYVLWGHRTNTNTVNTFDIEESADQLDARWSRTWGVDVNSPSGFVNVDLSFDFQNAGIGGTPSTATNYYLIRSLGTGLGWEIVSTASSIVGNAVNFENVTMSDGIYTLATGDLQNSFLSNVNITTGNGPAGIGSTTANDIALWLDASQLALSDGAAVATWPDLTTNDRDATQATLANQPIYESNVFNGRGVVRFNGTTQFMSGSLGASYNAPFTLIAVGRFAQNDQGADDNDYIFDLGSPGPGTPGTKASISRRRNNDAITRTNRYYSFQGGTPQYGPQINPNTILHAFGAVYQLRSPFHQLYFNGALSLSAPGDLAINSNGTYHLGRLNNTADVNYFLNGDITEIIIYNSVLSSTQIRIIQAYLAAKWSFNLNNDLYTGDQAGNGNNDLDVGGVGRSLDGDVGISTSAGMTVRLGTDAEAESFVMFGHSVASNSVNTTDISGAAIFERSNRAWYFDITGNTGITDSITFDFSDMGLAGSPGDPNNYVLIYRSGTSGNWTIVATANDTGGDQVYFTSVDLTTTGDGFYTLASINNAPLPVSLLSFDAKVVTEGKTNSVLLKWQTASELNNDYFTIERSVDAKQWTSITTMQGKGTFNGLSTYVSLDQNAPAGKVYYRLKQTDLDGQAKYVGGIRMVTIEYEEIDVSIFPNPSTGFINVLSKRGMLNNAELIVTDFTGKEMLTRYLRNEYQEQVQLTLKPGLYLISIKKNSHLLYSQRLMISE